MTYPESFFPTVKEKVPSGPRSLAWAGWMLAAVLVVVGVWGSPWLLGAGLLLAVLLIVSGVRRYRRRAQWRRLEAAADADGGPGR